MNDLVKADRIGSLDIDKGEARTGHVFYAWDAVQDCIKEHCPIFNKCNYPKIEKCAVQYRYVDTLCTIILTTYKYLDDVQLTKVGLQLIPLYSHLCRLKIIEKSITTDNIIQSTNKGKFVHPVFREIRQTLLMVNMMWRDLLIKPINLNIPDPSDPDAPITGDDPRIIEGDPKYYRNMSKQTTSRRKVTR